LFEFIKYCIQSVRLPQNTFEDRKPISSTLTQTPHKTWTLC